MDSCAGVPVQYWLLFWLCGALQSVLRDLQPPHQSSGSGNTQVVPAALLPYLPSDYCDSSVTEVQTATHTLDTAQGDTHNFSCIISQSESSLMVKLVHTMLVH